jgi:hypothetical protein
VWIKHGHFADAKPCGVIFSSRNHMKTTQEIVLFSPVFCPTIGGRFNVMVFYCVNRAILGGETNFVDGIRLIDQMKIIDPQLLERLIKTDVTYEKAGNYRTEKIIDLKDPELPKFNFNYYCLSPDANEEESQLNQDFFDFLERNIRGSYLEHNVRLNPGEGVLWWDHFLLHGRTPFEAHETNDRMIWKTGVQWRD